MSGWIIFLIIAVPLILGLVWVFADDALVRVPAGALGLLSIRGKATDTTLPPGPHFVPRLRQHSVEIYPSTEGVYRAASRGESDLERLDWVGPPVQVRLGDRTQGVAEYTVRLRLDIDQLRSVHERFGRRGIWGAVRDLSSREVRAALNDPEVSIADLYGDRRLLLEQRILDHLRTAMLQHGFIVSFFSLDHIDLGRADEAIQSAVRARLEMQREEAEFEMRVERARRDAAIARELQGVDAEVAIRYRQTDAWVDLASQMARASGFVPDPPARQGPAPLTAAEIETVVEPDPADGESA